MTPLNTMKDRIIEIGTVAIHEMARTCAREKAVVIIENEKQNPFNDSPELFITNPYQIDSGIVLSGKEKRRLRRKNKKK